MNVSSRPLACETNCSSEPADIALEDGLGAQARAHVLEPTVRARHELMIQPFVARQLNVRVKSVS